MTTHLIVSWKNALVFGALKVVMVVVWLAERLALFYAAVLRSHAIPNKPTAAEATISLRPSSLAAVKDPSGNYLAFGRPGENRHPEGTVQEDEQ